jgi:hypothetical protein
MSRASGITVEEPPKKSRNGKIITFYSYKGGTGRSMALANVAWILASHGLKVLTIDWDLEAPGLHRYFRPFLDDPELESTPGLVEFFSEFTEGSRRQALAVATTSKAQAPTEKGDSTPSWFAGYANLLRFASSINHDFPEGGTIDFVAAGRQGPSYGALVNAFQWGEFYERLGGGVFLEEVKAQLRADYDFVLIDSRTGLSDTAGICTVQMPDQLVVCFTLNRQSIQGAAAATESALRLRQKPSGEPGLRIWPVPTRVELAESDRLEAARLMAREHFSRFLWHLNRTERVGYWGKIEVLYHPVYAYEEILAVAQERPEQTATMLTWMERIANWITDGRVKALAPMGATKRESEEKREELKRKYLGSAPAPRTKVQPKTARNRIYLSYSQRDFEGDFSQLARQLEVQVPESRFFWDGKIPLGVDIAAQSAAEMAKADVLVAFIGENSAESGWFAKALDAACRAKKRIVPVVLEDRNGRLHVPSNLENIRAAYLHSSTWEAGLPELAAGLKQIAAGPRTEIIDPEDPQRGRWGGESRRDGREVTAKVRAQSADWFEVRLLVRSIEGLGLQGKVEFHLHDSFDPDVEEVAAEDGEARLTLHAVGAFTVGVLLEDGTTLELDLASLTDVPRKFRER